MLSNSQTGKLIISRAQGCVVAVQLPVPSLCARRRWCPAPITSAINGGLSSAVSGVNGALSPVNSAIGGLPTSLPTLPALPGVPGLPGVNPPGANPPGASAPGGGEGPGTIYQPTGPTVADRTVPDGYGSGSGLGGVYVPGSSAGDSAAGGSITAPGQQSGGGNGQPAGAATAAAQQAKPGGTPRTAELATTRPRSALGALPTLAVILAILALSGATAFYARTFLLQPVTATPAKAKAPVKR